MYATTILLQLAVVLSTYAQTLPEVDLDPYSLNTTEYLVQYCNVYCDGTEKKQASRLNFQTNPWCLECRCDAQCQIYGDCCPDENGTISRDQNPPTCLFSENDLDIQSKLGFGVFMVTECPDRAVTDHVFSPVYSVSRNMSFFNKEVAECNDVTDYHSWIMELDCTSGYGSGGSEADDIGLSDGFYDNEEDCSQVYSATRSNNPRICDPMLAAQTQVMVCNVSGLWENYVEEVEAACLAHNYPVSYKNDVYRNVFCAVCNGITPGRTIKYDLTGLRLPPPITVITQFLRPHKDIDEQHESKSTECGDDEWLHFMKDKCIPVYCSPGKSLVDGNCIWAEDIAMNDEYEFNVILKPQNEIAIEAIAHWNTVQQMFLKNFKQFMFKFRTSSYVFSVGLLEDMTSLQENQDELGFPRAVIIKCNFIVTQQMNRTELETKLYNFVTEMWIVPFDDNDHVFTPSFNNIPLSRVKLKARYWADPVSGHCCVPVADTFNLKQASGIISSRVIQVTNELFCPHVKLRKSEYEADASGWITLDSANISISSRDFSFDDKKRARVCVEVLNDIYNGSYKNRSNIPLIPTSVFVKQILSLVCVSVSLICLALTFITYCVFPPLRSLPAKNNMFLIGCLFLAQLLFQFGIDRTENNTVCTIIGVLIHFLWLCVIFWMNVCSFHMLRVFAVQNIIPQSRTRHARALLRYSVYAFGSAALVVAVTVTVSSVLSGGSDVGYGGIVCYLTSNKLVGFSFVLPLSVIVMMNLTFFIVTIRAISKIDNIKKHGMKERHNVYVYIKLSSLTGMFWIVAILAEVFQQEVLIYISIILNGSLGVLLFICYIANRRVYDLWKGLCDKLRPKRPLDDSRNATVSTSI
ncbi:uncharacterized protein [Haliotis cracherodii]|uniref:uncharacterized protein n=1 Tax=Haliotis cracherodii TaxID=6455 RepID=UPI0039EC7711